MTILWCEVSDQSYETGEIVKTKIIFICTSPRVLDLHIYVDDVFEVFLKKSH